MIGDLVDSLHPFLISFDWSACVFIALCLSRVCHVLGKMLSHNSGCSVYRVFVS